MPNSGKSDTPAYLEKKALLQQLLTVYGRKPVLEALQDKELPCFRLHLAESNKTSAIINDIKIRAHRRDIDIHFHDRQALARISKNGKQDQGVCLDIRCPKLKNYRDFLNNHDASQKIRLIALDRITNPQNLGMIIRSACAGKIDGILIPEKGCAKLDSLAIKASAGTVFKAPIIRCDELLTALQDCQQQGAKVIALSSQGQKALADYNEDDFSIYVLGNESEGVSQEIQALSDELVHIPMNNNVESLNVAVTASLLAFRHLI